MKKLIFLVMVLAALVMGALPASVNAICGQYVQVIKLYTYDDGYHSVYGRPLNQVLPGYCFYWYIANDDLELLNTCLAAQASGKPIYLWGEASTCPTSGQFRYGAKEGEHVYHHHFPGILQPWQRGGRKVGPGLRL